MPQRIEVSQEIVEKVKDLYENTKLGYKQIAKEIGITEGISNRIIRENEFKKKYIRPVDKLSKEYLEDLYLIQNKNIIEIAKITNCCKNAISKKLKEYNIPIKHAGHEPVSITKELLTELYVNQGLTQKEIANQLGCAISSLTKYFKKYNIKVRERGIPQETLKDMYINQNLSEEEIADKLGYKKNTIQILLSDMNLRSCERIRFIPEEELLKLILKGTSIKQICKHFKCSTKIVKYKLKKMGISPSKKALDNVPRETFYNLIILEGKNLKDIGKMYSVSDSTIKNRLSELNFNIILEKAKYLKERLPKEKLEELYLEKGLSQNSIAKMYNVGRCSISSLLKEYEIRKLSLYESITKEMLKELYVDQNLPPCIIAEKLNIPCDIVRSKIETFNLRKLKTPEEIELCKNKAYEKTLSNFRSKGEKSIQELFPTPYTNIHSIINVELDLWYPEKNVAIEYNGDYWHSIEFPKNSGLHIAKMKMCKNKGIHLINIFERDWHYSRSNRLLKVLLTRFLKPEELLNPEGTIEKISNYQKELFEDKYNLDKKGTGEFALGLKKDNTLICCLSYNLKGGKCLIDRFTTNSNYLEDYTQLIKYLKDTYEMPVIVKYDNRYYDKFPSSLIPTKEKDIEPELFYVKSRKALRKEEAPPEYISHSKCHAVYDCGYTEVTF